MSTHVSVNTFVHTVTHITAEMVRSLKDIVKRSGLSLNQLIYDWESLETAVYTWLKSRDLQKVTLEIFTPIQGELVGRWDFEIDYDYAPDGDGSLWVDSEAIRNAISKCQVPGASCKYEFKILHKPGAPQVAGWEATKYRSTLGFIQHSIGTTIGGPRRRNRNIFLQESIMITIPEAFEKFKGRLEPGDREEQDAIRRRERVKEVLDESFYLERVIITGSYRRWTKTKPLRDVDLFSILNAEKEGHYLKKSSRVLLDAFAEPLRKEYGNANVRVEDKCVTVNFGEPAGDDEEKVFSIDVVPAFEDGKAYKIPDAYHSTGWMKTDPEIHAELATKANKAMDGKWVTLVKMIKKCNEKHGKPIDPSFLVEVMALQLIAPPFSGGYKYEIKSFIASAAQQIDSVWEDPARLGPPVSDNMNAAKKAAAKLTLKKISESIDRAIIHEQKGQTGDALSTWRNEVFGHLFPLS